MNWSPKSRPAPGLPLAIPALLSSSLFRLTLSLSLSWLMPSPSCPGCRCHRLTSSSFWSWLPLTPSPSPSPLPISFLQWLRLWAAWVPESSPQVRFHLCFIENLVIVLWFYFIDVLLLWFLLGWLNFSLSQWKRLLLLLILWYQSDWMYYTLIFIFFLIFSTIRVVIVVFNHVCIWIDGVMLVLCIGRCFFKWIEISCFFKSYLTEGDDVYWNQIVSIIDFNACSDFNLFCQILCNWKFSTYYLITIKFEKHWAIHGLF